MKTKGEKRTRIDFNPSNTDYVFEIKQQAAKLIDLISQSAANPDWDSDTLSEWLRLKSLAMTSAEESAMWGVKAATI